MSQPIEVRIAHHIPGRTRLAAAHPRGEADLQACAARLSQDGRLDVQVRGGSLILTHHLSSAEEIRPALEKAGLSLVPPSPRHPIGKTSVAVSRINGALSEASGGSLDLLNIAFLGLVAGGFVQLARGNVAGPALTLFSQALTLALLHAKTQEQHAST
ncbi:MULTISPECIES: hypothetical protein [unclassified Xanthobacter]|uniref:hypothetical protein n=1 Tax=unclassified Xanthobacter TaxID=2623496 RepID=UPI001F29FB18|nr:MULTISPECIES: hypothetical protein [unclassified Xanthobacter]